MSLTAVALFKRHAFNFLIFIITVSVMSNTFLVNNNTFTSGDIILVFLVSKLLFTW